MVRQSYASHAVLSPRYTVHVSMVRRSCASHTHLSRSHTRSCLDGETERRLSRVHAPSHTRFMVCSLSLSRAQGRTQSLASMVRRSCASLTRASLVRSHPNTQGHTRSCLDGETRLPLSHGTLPMVHSSCLDDEAKLRLSHTSVPVTHTQFMVRIFLTREGTHTVMPRW